MAFINFELREFFCNEMYNFADDYDIQTQHRIIGRMD